MAGRLRLLSGDGHRFRRYEAKTFAVTGGRAFAYVLAVVFTVLEGAEFFLGVSIKGLWGLVAAFTISTLIGVGTGWRRSRLGRFEEKVNRRHSVEIVVGDFIETVRHAERANCVFGVNDAFSVVGLKNGSVHSDFLKHFCKELSVEQKQAALDACLPAPARTSPVDPLSGRVIYPYGTVGQLAFRVPSESEDRDAFLIVNSTRRNDSAYSGDGSSRDLLDRVWQKHEELKLVSERVVFALVGTGHSHDLDWTAAVVAIVDAFFRHLDRPVVRIRRLVVSVPERAVEDGWVDLEAVHAFVRARSSVHRASL